jgi:hypothetical protein
LGDWVLLHFPSGIREKQKLSTLLEVEGPFGQRRQLCAV